MKKINFYQQGEYLEIYPCREAQVFDHAIKDFIVNKEVK